MPVKSGQHEEPSSAELWVPSIFAAQLVQLTERWQVLPAALLEGTRLVEADLDDPQATVPLGALRVLFERAVQLTHEPGLGYHFGLQLKLSSYGSIIAATTPPTLRAALQVALRYVAASVPFLSLRLSEAGELATLALTDRLVEAAPRVFATEVLFTALVQLVRPLLGRSLTGLFELAYDEPPYFPGFAHLWAGPVRFGRPQSVICFAAENAYTIAS